MSIDDRTTTYNWPKPHEDNFLQEDVGRLRDALDGIDSAVAAKEVAANKGQPNGYAGLDSGGKVPSAQLPSYVDDVLEYANFAALPGTGEAGKIYVLATPYTSDGVTSSQFRWAGSAYVPIVASPGTTNAVTEGSTNLYFTAARVRDAVLTGLSTATSAAIAATDSVLAAFGKLQAQINGKQNALSTVSQEEAEAGTATTERLWTAERVKQAVEANTPPSGSPIGTIITLPPGVDPGEGWLPCGQVFDKGDYPELAAILGVQMNAFMGTNPAAVAVNSPSGWNGSAGGFYAKGAVTDPNGLSVALYSQNDDFDSTVGYHVAVSSNGFVSLTTNTVYGDGNSINLIDYHLDNFILIGSGRVARSTNGTSWTKTTTTVVPSGSPSASCVAKDDRLIVVANNGGSLSTSDNGTSFTARTSGVSVALRGVAYNPVDEVLVAIGDSNTIIRSTDNGVTWATITFPYTNGSQNSFGLRFHNGTFTFAFVEAGNTYVCQSKTGAAGTWRVRLCAFRPAGNDVTLSNICPVGDYFALTFNGTYIGLTKDFSSIYFINFGAPANQASITLCGTRLVYTAPSSKVMRATTVVGYNTATDFCTPFDVVEPSNNHINWIKAA